MTYQDLPLNQTLPDDLLEQLENVLFIVDPYDPPQLWRSTAYDGYDGSGWTKTQVDTTPLDSTKLITRAQAETQGNAIYTVFINVSAGAATGSVELPALFPQIQVIQDSFQSHPNGLLLQYTLETDDYDTLLFNPLIEGESDEYVLISYEVTYRQQDLTNVANNAMPGSFAPDDIYKALDDVQPLSQRVQDNASQFIGAGDNAYEMALLVDAYFRTTFELMIDDYQDRPEPGREVTDWFIERGGGLPMDFATAYCVYMRLLDIPARMTIGYALGDQEGTQSVVRVRHMMFWSEVYIPLSGGGGEWIQVVPIPLPDDMGGGDIPENIGAGDLQIRISSNLAPPWAVLGDPFDLSAVLLLQGLPAGEGATIRFRDETAFLHLGIATIVQGVANFTYAFPLTAALGSHNMSATYDQGAFSVTNFTEVFAVAQPEPLGGSGFTLSETIDVNLKLGWDNYTSVWADTIHAHGLMTVGGEPVDGTTLINDQVQIMWDETWMGNATIQADGTYQHDILVDAIDPRMSTGTHETWSSYAGEYRQGVPYLFPAQSFDNSTVDVWGKTSFTLNVIPSPVFRGTAIMYDGQIELLDGTPLIGEDVGLFFNETFLFNVTTNSTGGFSAPYIIPGGYAPGIYNAQANWSSTIDHILGNWSETVLIQVTIRGAELTIDSVPQPPAETLHVWENITIFGQLYDPINSSGLANKWVDIYWQNSTGPHLIGTVLTNATGHYELEYTALPSDIGTATYQSKWEGSSDPNYLNANSSSMTITVKKWDIELTIAVNPTFVHPHETTRIEGLVRVPEYPGLLTSAPVRIWWTNSSGTFNIGNVISNATGGYVYDHEVPFSHPEEIVTVWTQFVETSTFAGDNSSMVPVTVERLSSIISVYSNATHYHLDEVVHIWGRLQNGSDGSPFADMTVQIYWDDGTQHVFNATTNSTGWYDFYYNLTLGDPTGTVAVWVEWNSTIPTQSDASATLTPSLTVQLYQVTLTGTPDSTSHFLDEVIVFSGTLTLDVNGTPLAGEIITIHYVNSSGEFTFQKTTDVTGSYSFLYNLSISDNAEDIQMWASFTSLNPYVESDTSAIETVTLSLYVAILDVSFDVNPVYLNETVTISVHLYFSHNGTDISGAVVSLWWDNSTGLSWIANVTTNMSGQASHPYSGMHGYTDLSPQVFGIYDGTQLIEGIESTHEPLTLQRWATTITGFGTNGITFYLTETVIANGTLEHGSSVPFGGVVVEMFVVGVGVVDTDTTASDGFFTCSWTIPQSTTPGSYDVTVRYLSTVNWIESHTEIPITIDISAYTLIWVPFDATPNPIYITENLNISGVLSLDNGTPYSSAGVDIWGRHSIDFVDFFIVSLLTDGSGRYWVVVEISEAIPPGILQVWANCTPADSSISSGQSPIIPVLIQQIPVNLTANASTSLAYRGASVTVSGNLTFANGTAMVGYVVEIILGGIPVDSVTITDGVAGSFSVVYVIEWDHSLGPSNIYARFSSPTPAIENAQTAPESLEIWDSVALHLDVQSVTTLNIGESLIVTGFISNANGAARGIELAILVDGNPILAATSQSDGSFSRTWTDTSAYPLGDHVLSLASLPGYYDVTSNVDTWTITLVTQSALQVRFDPSTPPDIMPGESYSFIITLTDYLGNAIPGATVTFYLDSPTESTLIGFGAITSSSEHTFGSVLSADWDTSGYYTIRVEYAGATGVLPSSAETSETLHIFTDNVDFDMSGTLTVATLGQVFTFNGLLMDENGDPIAGRSIVITVNFTTTINRVTTGPDGTFTATVTAPAVEGAFTYRITLTSTEVADVYSRRYTVSISGPLGISPGMMLIIWILVISVEGIIALLVIARYRRSYTRFFRSYKPGLRINTSFNHHKGKRW
ncbi:MAG: transglutaminase domain-containing protein [Candidatus Thorarchaeota archaeon]